MLYVHVLTKFVVHGEIHSFSSFFGKVHRGHLKICYMLCVGSRSELSLTTSFRE